MKKKSLPTRIIVSGKNRLSPEEIEACRDVIESGGILIFPTDTVYGIACNAFNPIAVGKIYALKGRSYSKPLPILLPESHQLNLVAKEVPPESKKLIDAYWPGPLTLVFKTAPMAAVASHGRHTIAVRVPDHGVVRHILTTVQIPLAATSANSSGKPSLTDGKEAVKLFNGKVDLIIDGGVCEWRKESSVVDATHYPFTVIREGAISKSHLAKQLNLA